MRQRSGSEDTKASNNVNGGGPMTKASNQNFALFVPIGGQPPLVSFFLLLRAQTGDDATQILIRTRRQ